MSNSPKPDHSLLKKATLRLGAFRHSAVVLLGALVLLLVVTPFVEELPQGASVEAVLVTLLMVLAVLAVGGQVRSLAVSLLLVAPALLAKWSNHVRPGLVPAEIHLAASVIFFAFVIGQLLRFILRAERVDANVLCAGISGYLMVGLLWVPTYLLADRASPAAFAFSGGPEATHVLDGFNALYFSFLTLTTVGYGDITPVSKVARMLSILEAITGVFYMAVLISRLVAVYTSVKPAPPDTRPAGQN